jgi:hypothetical protein
MINGVYAFLVGLLDYVRMDKFVGFPHNLRQIDVTHGKFVGFLRFCIKFVGFVSLVEDQLLAD